ncbi:conserved hypothetical protein [Lausannevirus]|uniref:Uncharacterized protein n=2 Tax=Lausannevirus TaxID=999883 RepID=A0A0N7G2G4_9VIRU|nr:hypothetical protein LAU_0397 [Lausannevirus]AEA07247.1 conserved hypothetical protein [Lausannevirus]ALH07056.1 hypothetical protein PMV_358 [Port-miou virus]
MEQELFPSVYVVVLETFVQGEAKCLFFSKDIEDAILFAKNHMNEIQEAVDPEEYRTFLNKGENYFLLKVQEMGLLWDGPITFHTRLSVQRVESVCERV